MFIYIGLKPKTVAQAPTIDAFTSLVHGIGFPLVH